MKIIHTTNQELLEVLQENGINVMCNENMDMIISDEEAARIDDVVKEFAPASLMDYAIENVDAL